MKRTLGRYELKSSKRGEVGENVYFGTDLELNRQVAIKEINRLNAARSEAIALAACGPHEFIPTVYDFFVFSGKGYIVMEHVNGHELGGDRNGRPKPQEKAVALTMNILRALRHIHSKGYLHLDIKPKNVIVTDEATSKIKLIDFGGAVLKKPSGFFKGKPKAGYPPYMPPEQFDNPSYLDDSADLYQAAGVCVFLLTGKRPIEVEDDEIEDDEYYPVCRKHQLKGLSRDIADNRLKVLLIKALHPNPADRFRSAKDFIDALQHFRNI